MEALARTRPPAETPATAPRSGAQEPLEPPHGHVTRWPFAAPPKYQLLRGIGSGGMGTVVLARDRQLGRLVALKFLRESCEVFLERFRREGRVMARLSHPAIVRVHELDVFEGRPYLAMQYVDGGNLALARLEPRALIDTLRDVVDALAHAHERGVVHRDVKPENVLLDRDGRAHLTDFGLALGPDEGLPRSLARPVVGTPLCMSPEQARGEEVGPASDVFSLGVTLYRQLTGTWPFRGRTVADVLDAIRHAAPADPTALAPEVQRSLERIVLRCLEKDPARRYSSMAELGEALDRFLALRSPLSRVLARLRGERPTHRSPRGPRIHPEELS